MLKLRLKYAWWIVVVVDREKRVYHMDLLDGKLRLSSRLYYTTSEAACEAAHAEFPEGVEV
jgi:hypothetical protein